MGLVEDGNCAAAAAYTLIAGDFGNIDQDGRGRHVVGGYVVRRRLVREDVQDVLGKAGRQVFGYVVDVVGVHAWFAACDCDARFGSRA